MRRFLSPGGGWLASGVALFLIAAVPLNAQELLPLQEKTQYEKMLEEKVESVLTRILGPNQAQAFINATFDFSRTETVKTKTKNRVSNEMDISSLPGFPSLGPDTTNKNQGTSDQSYEKLITYPTDFLKRLSATVVVNKNISDEETQRVRAVVADLLKINPDQGDILTVVQAPFPPVWRNVMQDPELTKLLFRYSLLGLMTLMTLGVMALCFLKLAAALNAMAKAQVHQVSMDLPIEDRLAQGPYKELPPPGVPELPGTKESQEGAQEASKEEEMVYFGVRKDQVELLAQMLKREEPENVALVAAHLKPEVQQEFLGVLPSEARTAVLMKLGAVRFVEPDMIMRLKDEIERRLQGAVGGTRMILEVLERSTPLERRKIFADLELRDPRMARSVRLKVLMPEDLVRLDEREFALLVSSIGSEEWSAALWELPEEFVSRVKMQLTEGAWKIVEQRMALGRPSDSRIDKAQQKVLETACSLIEAGKISSPAPAEMQPLPAASGMGPEGGVSLV